VIRFQQKIKSGGIPYTVGRSSPSLYRVISQIVHLLSQQQGVDETQKIREYL
jgi:hypothetical protein